MRMSMCRRQRFSLLRIIKELFRDDWSFACHILDLHRLPFIHYQPLLDSFTLVQILIMRSSHSPQIFYRAITPMWENSLVHTHAHTLPHIRTSPNSSQHNTCSLQQIITKFEYWTQKQPELAKHAVTFAPFILMESNGRIIYLG